MIKLNEYRKILDFLELNDLHLFKIEDDEEAAQYYLKDKPISFVEFATHFILHGDKVVWYGRTNNLLRWLEVYTENQSGIKQFLDSREPYVDEE